MGKTNSPEDFTSLLTDVTERLFDRLPDATWVYPGHGNDTTWDGATAPRRCWPPGSPCGRRPRRLLVFDGAYHGSATLFLAGTGRGPGAVERPAAVAALLGRPDHDVAAVFAQPFLGAGGVRPAAPGFLAAVAALADDLGVPFCGSGGAGYDGLETAEDHAPSPLHEHGLGRRVDQLVHLDARAAPPRLDPR